MNHRLALTIPILLLATALVAQEISKDNIVKYKIRSITTISEDNIAAIEYYNDNGDIVKICDNDDGVEKIRKEFVYDSIGILNYEKTYRSDGQLHQLIKYYYDASKRLIKTELYDPNEVDVTTTYDYDAMGKQDKRNTILPWYSSSCDAIQVLGNARDSN